MSELITRLRTAGQQHSGTGLGGLLQWAALHIEMQNEALADIRQEHADEEKERLRLDSALNAAKTSIEAVLAIVNAAMFAQVEIGRDMAPHINLMAGHGDPDYLTKRGESIRHVDCRTTKPRIKKESA